MNCPKCNNIELKKKEFNSPYFCPSCGGMWLMDIKSPISSIEMEDKENGDSLSKENDKKTGLCPYGHGIMIRAKIEIAKPFYLEKCIQCGGIWFDKGEWNQIFENNFMENLNLFWLSSWQAEQMKKKSREKFLEQNLSIFGPKIFNMVIELSQELKDHPEKDRAIALLRQEIL